MLAVADVEDVVEFLESEIFGFGEQEVGVDPAEDVPGGVPGEAAGDGEGFGEGGPGEGDDEVEALFNTCQF